MWEICVVSFVLTVFEQQQLNVVETYKECAVNKVSLCLRSNEKSSQPPM
jgi:hypothetical protein